MSNFDQYIQYRALSFKFGNPSHLTPDSMQKLIDNGAITGPAGEKITDVDQVWPEELKNLCAKVPVALIDKIEEVIGPLRISKREFVQMAVEEALDRAQNICNQVDMFEYYDREEAATEGAK